MVLKWFKVDISNEFKSRNPNETVHNFLYADIVQTQLLVLDDCVKNIMALEDNSKIEYLKGYLYDSPSHEGIVCWRALAEEHNLENVKHLLNSIDYETQKTPSPKYETLDKTNNFNNINYHLKPSSIDIQYSESRDSGIYEGCYNGHHEKTTQEIRRVLNKIYDDLLKKKSSKNSSLSDIIPINAHEAKLLDEYEKITSKLSPAQNKQGRKPSLDSVLSNQETSSSTDKNRIKIEYPETSDYETSLKKLEKQSINKAEDELLSDCEIFCDNKKSLTSSSLSSDYVRPVKTQQEVKKVIPPRRKRHRLHAYLDKEVSSSDDYDVTKNPNFIRNKLRDSKQKSAFKKVDQGINNENKEKNIEKNDQNKRDDFARIPESKGLWTQQVPEDKGLWSQNSIENKNKESKFVQKRYFKEKTDEELISEFERFSPRKSTLYPNEKKDKYEEIYDDLNNSSIKAIQNRSTDTNINFQSIKNYDDSKKKIEPLNENSPEEGPKINYLRPNSPVKLSDHVMTLYPVQVQNKPGSNQPFPNSNQRGPPLGYIGSPNMAKPKLPGGPENKPKFEVNTSINNYIKQANKKFQYKNDQKTNPPVQPKFKFLHKFSNKFIKKVNSVKRR